MENKSLPVVIPLTTAQLFLTNPIKNYNFVFFGNYFIEQVQNKPGQEKCIIWSRSLLQLI